jgi:PHD/YefM family antitoxin component YafN of YafNO toxin-antitoxin module
VFTQEDRKRLKIVAEEVPKIRSLMEELLETIDILGNSEELEAIRESLEQVKRGETRSWDAYVDELRKKGEIQTRANSQIRQRAP